MTLRDDRIDLLVDPVTGDLDISTDLQFSSDIDGAVQSVTIALKVFKGEVFYNLDTGVPYFEDVLGQQFDEGRIRSVFRAQILSLPEIVTVNALELDWAREGRALGVFFRVSTIFGDTEGSVTI